MRFEQAHLFDCIVQILTWVQYGDELYVCVLHDVASNRVPFAFAFWCDDETSFHSFHTRRRRSCQLKESKPDDDA